MVLPEQRSSDEVAPSIVAPPTGTLRLIQATSAALELLVPVERGAFELERSPEAKNFTVDRFENELLLAIPIDVVAGGEARPLLEEDSSPVVELRIVPDLVLHVRSEETGVALEGVRVSEVLGEDQ
ncbi:MAG: hypothetical protein ACI8QS_000683 [Planctomycetota bacterium]